MYFQIFLAFLFSFLICFVLGDSFIKLFKKFQGKGQPIREDGPESHFSKAGTPTMGGIMILGSAFISTLVFADLSNKYIWLIWFVIISHAILGFMDDYLKVKKSNAAGVRGKLKLLFQLIIASIACFVIHDLSPEAYNTHVIIPFFQEYPLNVSYLYIPFGLFIMLASSNGANLTDGLDGLVSIPLILNFTFFGFVAYSMESAIITIPNASEISILCASLVGGILGFLWYNSNPAQIFMGDVGSLSLGAGIGVMSIILKHELWLAIVGMIFVIESLSVIIQVYYFKWSGGKRIFKMAPIHHHFEKAGIPEVKVVIRFWIFSLICTIVAFSIL